MQTFMPYPDFIRVAQVLDDKRLGKQRVEARQILDMSPASRWRHHPAVRMWQGYDEALKLYINCMVKEWIQRGFVSELPTTCRLRR